MGLLSLAKDVNDMTLISQELNWYDTEDTRSLYLWKNVDQNWSGLVGVEIKDSQIIVHELALSPQESRQSNYNLILSDLQMTYPESKIIGDLDTARICKIWEQERMQAQVTEIEDESDEDVIESTDANFE